MLECEYDYKEKSYLGKNNEALTENLKLNKNLVLDVNQIDSFDVITQIRLTVQVVKRYEVPKYFIIDELITDMKMQDKLNLTSVLNRLVDSVNTEDNK